LNNLTPYLLKFDAISPDAGLTSTADIGARCSSSRPGAPKRARKTQSVGCRCASPAHRTPGRAIVMAGRLVHMSVRSPLGVASRMSSETTRMRAGLKSTRGSASAGQWQLSRSENAVPEEAGLHAHWVTPLLRIFSGSPDPLPQRSRRSRIGPTFDAVKRALSPQSMVADLFRGRKGRTTFERPSPRPSPSVASPPGSSRGVGRRP